MRHMLTNLVSFGHCERAMVFLAAAISVSGGAAGQSALTPPTHEQVRVVTAESRQSGSARGVPGCPSNSGLLDSVSVPVNQPLDLRLQLGSPAPAGGASFRIQTDDPTIVAAGDRLQAFLPVVTVPAGQTQSSQFRVFGIFVGRTTLRSTPLTPGFTAGATPITAWDLNPGAPAEKKFLDANPPANFCRASAASIEFSSDPARQSRCGKSVEGISADGLSKLLLRVGAGLSGTACFEIVSTSADDQGQLATAIAPLSQVGTVQWAGSYYTAPKTYGSNGESRQIDVEVTYTPNIGNGNTSRVRYSTKIVRPPVVFVHGLWGNANSFSEWAEYQPAGDFRTFVSANYALNNAAGFATNRAALKPFVDQALQSQRRRFASTRVDVVAHSMGGIVSRLHIGRSDFKTAQNLNEGDVRRLVTLVTPHYGSSFANLLVALHRANPADTAQVVRDVAGGAIAGGAVCDLAENSAGLRLPELNTGTALLSQVFSASGGPLGTAAEPAPFFGGRFGRGDLEGALTFRQCSRTVFGVCTERLGPFTFPQATVDAFRFRGVNDTIVPLSSQLGGVATAGANFANVIHSGASGAGGLVVVDGMTNTRAVATATFALLDGPDTGFQGSLGGVISTGSGEPRTVPGRGVALDQADYADQCTGVGPLAPTPSGGLRSAAAVTRNNPGLRMLTPTTLQALTAGSVVDLLAQFDPSIDPIEPGFSVSGGIGFVDAGARVGQQFSLRLQLPLDLAGPVSITPTVRASNGSLVEGVPVNVRVVPAQALTSLQMLQSDFELPPTAGPVQLVVQGRYGAFATASPVDVTGLGVSYTSSNEAVARVDINGRVAIVGPGLATVRAAFSGKSAFASFVVADPVQPALAQDLSASVTLTQSGFQLNRATGFFVQTLTLTNNTQTVLPGPLVVTVNGLSSGVTLVGGSVGTTSTIAPLGSAYVGLPLPGMRLLPGQAVSVRLEFLNPSRTRIAYVPRLYWTNGQP